MPISWRGTRWLWLLVTTAALVAGCGGGSDKADEQVAKLELAQHSLLLTAPGQERQLSVRALNAGGGQVDANNVVWTSSTPDQVSVDSNGDVKSVTPIGSAMIFAESGGVRSQPMFVSTVELHPGTLLVRDVDVARIDPPLTPNAGEDPDLGTLYDVWLANVPAPAVGTIVLATETAAVAGRVVETAPDGALVRVRLEIVAAPDLLARYDVNWVVDLNQYDLVFPETSNERDQPQAMREVPLADDPNSREWKIPRGGASPLRCEASIAAKLTTKPVEVKATSKPRLEIISHRLDSALPPGRLRVALVGDLVIETSLGFKADVDLSAAGKCELKGPSVPLPAFPPPIGPLVRMAVPFGFGLSVDAKVKVASMDISLVGRNGASFELGVDCPAAPAPCASLDKADPINDFKPHLELSDTQHDGLEVDIEAMAYLLSGLNVVLIAKEFEMIEVKAGPKQSMDFGSVKRQVKSPIYHSKYDLKFAVEVSPGSSLKKAIKKLVGDGRGDLSFSAGVDLEISESPNGTWQPDKTTAIPDRDTVTFTIDLKDKSKEYFKLGYNVRSIEIYRRREGEIEFSYFDRIAATEPQMKFQKSWSPTLADAGKNEFAMFAVSTLPVVFLEILPNSVKTVQVGCIGGTGNGRERPQAVGVCKEEWVGSASGVITDFQEFTTVTPLLWEPDLSLQFGPNISALRPKGSVKVKLLAHTNLGCTVTPEVFDSFDPFSSLMTVDRNFNPAKYVFNVKIASEITISCPNADPLTFTTTVLNFQGLGDLTEQGTVMAGGTSTPQANYSYRFQLKEPDPPPPP